MSRDDATMEADRRRAHLEAGRALVMELSGVCEPSRSGRARASTLWAPGFKRGPMSSH